ncbi:MAG: hypothetical protein HYY02_05390 [Chloroflexi bacterium]|nr:hypothetical protein [Chloroflexota bacterium]
MAAKPQGVQIHYFLEDLGQEKFIDALVRKVVRQELGNSVALEVHIGNAAGGSGAVLDSLNKWLDRYSDGRDSPPDVLVLAIDGNCSGYNARKREIQRRVQEKHYGGSLVCAVPNPHMEKWYLSDPTGFRQCFESPYTPVVPRHKCERNKYKGLLASALSQSGVDAPLGGAEYGADIVECIDLNRASQNDISLKKFLSDLRAALRRLSP